jgi:hypothetical protein
MISTDDPYDESPCCLFCDRQVGLDIDAIGLCVGSRTRSTKSGCWYFNPEQFDDNDDVKWFHFHCIQTAFDFSNAPDNPDEDRNCMFCGAPLDEEVMYYEFALGRFQTDRHDTTWIPTLFRVKGSSRQVRSYACHDCVFDGLGEGNGERARYILGMDAKEEEPVRSPRIPIRTRPRGIPRRAAK